MVQGVIGREMKQLGSHITARFKLQPLVTRIKSVFAKFGFHSLLEAIIIASPVRQVLVCCLKQWMADEPRSWFGKKYMISYQQKFCCCCYYYVWQLLLLLCKHASRSDQLQHTRLYYNAIYRRCLQNLADFTTNFGWYSVFHMAQNDHNGNDMKMTPKYRNLIFLVEMVHVIRILQNKQKKIVRINTDVEKRVEFQSPVIIRPT